MKPDTDKLIFEDGEYFYPRDSQPKMLEEQVGVPRSRYSFTWRGIGRPHDRELGIAGGELILLDMHAGEVLAVRRGYVRTGGVRQTVGGVWWLGALACPLRPIGSGTEFIFKVLQPSK